MASPKISMDRRALMAGLGAAALTPLWPVAGRAQTRSALALQARAGSLALRPEHPGHAGLVAARARTALQARRDPRYRLRQRTAGAYCAQLAWDRWRPGRRAADGPASARGRGQGGPATAVASRRDLPVRPQPAGGRPSSTVAGTGADREGKRGHRRRSRRGYADRGLAAQARWNRDPSRNRSWRCRANPYD